MPDELGPRHILVNIPRFYLVAREDGRAVLDLRVVVGKRGDETPTFSSHMTHVVLSPYWNIPDSIVADETLPSGFATRFSNEPDSHQSSLGLFLTEQPYIGKHGYSLRLNGLEPANDRALERAIVIHGASYVSEASRDALGRLGRSWGCPALRPGVTRDVIDRIKGGSVVFAFYPDQSWLQQSPFLGGCASAAPGVSASLFM